MNLKKSLLKLVYGIDLEKGIEANYPEKICQHDPLHFRGHAKKKKPKNQLYGSNFANATTPNKLKSYNSHKRELHS